MSDQVPEIQPEPRPEPGVRNPTDQKRKYWLFFAIGFIGWYLMNGIIWALAPFSKNFNSYNVVLTLPGNILVLLILATIKRTRWIAFGMLAAIALNFLISLVLGLFNQAVCLVPFFSPK